MPMGPAASGVADVTMAPQDPAPTAFCLVAVRRLPSRAHSERGPRVLFCPAHFGPPKRAGSFKLEATAPRQEG